jgi:hypothetical protein
MSLHYCVRTYVLPWIHFQAVDRKLKTVSFHCCLLPCSVFCPVCLWLHRSLGLTNALDALKHHWRLKTVGWRYHVCSSTASSKPRIPRVREDGDSLLLEVFSDWLSADLRRSFLWRAFSLSYNRESISFSDKMQNVGSLVKYQTPILINTVGGRNNKKATKKAGNADKQITQTEDILNSILPPRSVKATLSWSWQR